MKPDDISTQLHLAARDNRQAAKAIEALEWAQDDAKRANEALKNAQDEAKAAQRAAEQSLAKLKAMPTADADAYTEDVLRIVMIKMREGQRPLVVIRGNVDFVELIDRDALNRLITVGKLDKVELIDCDRLITEQSA